MFWRSHCCYHCARERARRSFAAGLVAMVMLFAVGAAILHYHSLRLHGLLNTTSHHHHRSHHAAPRHRKVIHPTPTNRDRSRPAATTPHLTWTSFHGIGLPGSTATGPRHTRNGLASGFTDTAPGALVAAINIGVRTAAQWGPAIFRPTITSQVTGPDAPSLLRAETTAYNQLRAADHLRPGQPAGSSHAVEAGYRFVSYTAAAATIDIVTAGPGATGAVLTATRIEVVWRAGDWRVVAPPGGNWASAATVISSLAGYTAFPGR